MSKNSDIRWQQRFYNYERALHQLETGVMLADKRELSNLEKQGLIQSFEFTHELAWKVLKDYFLYQGNSNITGSRDAIREAFAQNLIEDGDSWMESIVSRNMTSHTYNEETANEIVTAIVDRYFHCFCQLRDKMALLANNNG